LSTKEIAVELEAVHYASQAQPKELLADIIASPESEST